MAQVAMAQVEKFFEYICDTFDRVAVAWQARLPSYFRKDVFHRNGAALAAVLAWFLGCVHGFGALLAYYSDDYFAYGYYLVLVTSFHFLEYLLTAMFQPDNSLTADSFLINHSRPYVLAFLASAFEYWMELTFFPAMKQMSFMVWLGILVTFVGQAVRSLGMFTLRHNFTHMVADSKKETHMMVTNGILKYIRHPAYFGFFYWAVGLQIILFNPVCGVALTYVTLEFFRERIPDEEKKMMEFDGFSGYDEYRRRTRTGIPTIP